MTYLAIIKYTNYLGSVKLPLAHTAETANLVVVPNQFKQAIF